MYGLLLMNMQEYVEKTFGAKKWVEIKEALKIKVTISKIEYRLNVMMQNKMNLLEFSTTMPLS